jgi:hypothetical protein
MRTPSHRPQMRLSYPPGKHIASFSTSERIGRTFGPVFCTLHSTAEGNTSDPSLHAYSIEPSGNSRLPEYVPVEIGTFKHGPGHPIRQGLIYKPGGRLHRTSSSIFIFACSPNGQAYILRYPATTQRVEAKKPPDVPYIVPLGKPLEVSDLRLVDLCFATGRMVVVRPPSGDAMMEIEVIEFLTSPGAR